MKKRSLYKWSLLGGMIGALTYVCICGVKTLNPYNYDWILNVYHDSTLSFLGCIFYDKASYAEGVFSCINMSYPHQLSIIFTDAIVPFAVVLKPFFRLFAREHQIIQYLGIWSIVCYVLQGAFAAILFRKTVKNETVCFIGIIILCLSPTMVQRLYVPCIPGAIITRFPHKAPVARLQDPSIVVSVC